MRTINYILTIHKIYTTIILLYYYYYKCTVVPYAKKKKNVFKLVLFVFDFIALQFTLTAHH